jgi:hypothetical protein
MFLDDDTCLSREDRKYGYAPLAFRAFFRCFARVLRTFALAAAAFRAIAIRLAGLSFSARALPPFGPPSLPPMRPDSLKNSIISVIDPKVLFFATPQAYELEPGACLL